MRRKIHGPKMLRMKALHEDSLWAIVHDPKSSLTAKRRAHRELWKRGIL